MWSVSAHTVAPKRNAKLTPYCQVAKRVTRTFLDDPRNRTVSYIPFISTPNRDGPLNTVRMNSICCWASSRGAFGFRRQPVMRRPRPSFEGSVEFTQANTHRAMAGGLPRGDPGAICRFFCPESEPLTVRSTFACRRRCPSRSAIDQASWFSIAGPAASAPVDHHSASGQPRITVSKTSRPGVAWT